MANYKRYTALSKKEISKNREELIALHKKAIITYLIQRDLKFSDRNKFMKLYDVYIDASNIQNIFFLPVKILVKAIILDRVEDINDYLLSHRKKSKKRKHANKKSKNKHSKTHI